MGYRTYLGYIDKTNLSKIMEEVYKLELLIGTSKPNSSDLYQKYDITEYLTSKATELIEFGNLAFLPTNDLYNFLISNKTKDYSNSDTEFYFLNDNERHFFYKLSCIQQQMWIDANKNFKNLLDKIIANNYKIDLVGEDKITLCRFKQSLEREEHMLEYSKRFYDSDTIFPPYNENQFNYVAVETFLTFKDKAFDYDNKILCCWGY